MTAGAPGAGERRVVRAGSPEHFSLEARGWVVIARSWAAGLDARNLDRDALTRLVERVRAIGGIGIRELTTSEADATAVRDLDRETAGDYPGDIATAHEPLPAELPVVSEHRRAWGAFDGEQLVAVTVLDTLGTGDDARPTETDFTVVRRGWRGRGLGTAVKAASVLALCAEGHRRFRTGGAAENTASLRASKAIGYLVDEEWVTLRGLESAPPDRS